jgi:hypothetical protein
MKFKIHFTKDDVEDCFLVEGEDIDDIRRKANANLEIRHCDVEEANVWSEEIK